MVRQPDKKSLCLHKILGHDGSFCAGLVNVLF